MLASARRIARDGNRRDAQAEGEGDFVRPEARSGGLRLRLGQQALAFCDSFQR